MNNEIFARNTVLYGQERMKKLFDSKVTIIGLGGVGSYCASSIARSGIGSITVVDFDVVEKSNINRQECAVFSTLGRYKSDIMCTMIKDINPQICIDSFCERVDCTNTSKFCSNADYVIDCIDNVAAKLEIVKYCQNNGIKVVSCMGTAQRIHPECLTFGKIYDTKNCPLCKKVRHESRTLGLQNFDVVYSTEKPIAKTQELGSSSFVPPAAGFMLSSFVVNNLAY